MMPDTPIELVNDYLTKAFSIVNGLDSYLAQINKQTIPLLEYIRNFSLQTDWTSLFEQKKILNPLTSEMLVDETEVSFLCFLIQSINAKNILEIGMFTGYSAAAFALASSEDAQITTIERETFLRKQAERYFNQYGVGRKIHILNQIAQEGLSTLKKPFDFIFVDANKDGYLEYYHTILEKDLLSENGILCFDNTLMKGSVYTEAISHPDGKTIHLFNEAVAADKRVSQVLLPIRDGLTLVRWKK